MEFYASDDDYDHDCKFAYTPIWRERYSFASQKYESGAKTGYYELFRKLFPDGIDWSRYHEDCQRHLAKKLPCCGFKPPAKAGGNYLLTFTMKPELDKNEFRASVLKQLERDVILKGAYSFEHPDSNLHCHALVSSSYNLTKGHFKSQARKWGHVDVRKVEKDNGIAEYISKESVPTAFEN